VAGARSFADRTELDATVMASDPLYTTENPRLARPILPTWSWADLSAHR
jgi:hypothetical protein